MGRFDDVNLDVVIAGCRFSLTTYEITDRLSIAGTILC